VIPPARLDGRETLWRLDVVFPLVVGLTCAPEPAEVPDTIDGWAVHTLAVIGVLEGGEAQQFGYLTAVEIDLFLPLWGRPATRPSSSCGPPGGWRGDGRRPPRPELRLLTAVPIRPFGP
jgi:hypothetical protein